MIMKHMWIIQTLFLNISEYNLEMYGSARIMGAKWIIPW